jgi:hypothetical protein
MTVARFAVSFERSLAEKVRKAAGNEPISTWLGDAAERKLRSAGLLAVVAEWEDQHGKLDAPVVRPSKAARAKTKVATRSLKRRRA